jgi:hypothetical protein
MSLIASWKLTPHNARKETTIREEVKRRRVNRFSNANGPQ